MAAIDRMLCQAAEHFLYISDEQNRQKEQLANRQMGIEKA